MGHSHRWLTAAALVGLVTATGWAAGLERLSIFTTPREPQPVALARLPGALALDGKLDEWARAACIPVRSAGAIAHRVGTHQWRGPVDSGLELRAAWNRQGLCLAAVVADDELHNDRPESELWQQDCLELFVDGRPGAAFGTGRYSPGAFQLLVRPPLPDRPAVVVAAGAGQSVAGIGLAARRTETGYLAEILIPWELFPGLQPGPGTPVGLQAGLDDWDTPDGSATQPQMMTIGGVGGLAANPARFVPFRLVEQAEDEAVLDLGPQMPADLPRIVAAPGPVHLGVTAGGRLAARTRLLQGTLTDSAGAVVWQGRLQPAPLAAPWADSWEAGQQLDLGGLRPNRYRLSVLALDAEGAPIGQNARDVFVLGEVLTPLYGELGRVDLKALADTEPFRAAAYCAVGVAIERYKRAVETGDIEEAVRAQHEAVARLEQLAGAVPANDPAEDWLGLLRLGADPAAQVVVEYPPGYRTTGVTFLYGPMPLATVVVTLYPTAQAARQAFDSGQGQMGSSAAAEEASVAGRPGKVWPSYDYQVPFEPAAFAAASQVLLTIPGSKQLRVVPLAALGKVSAAAAVVLPACPDAVRQQVLAWATERGVAVLPLPAALDSLSVLVAGDPRLGEAAPAFAAYTSWHEVLQQRTLSLSVLDSNRVLQVWHPSRQVGERAIGLVLAGAPVTAAQVDSLRRAVLAWAGRGPTAPAALPSAAAAGGATPPLPTPVPSSQASAASLPFWGDVHSHTFYSDGASSPTANVLEAIAAHLDYLVMTDHNTLDGARVALRLAADHGVALPLIQGEEVTTSYAHFCAYPVTQLVPWDTTAAAICQAAHAQEAAVQWNHPGYPGSPWDSGQQRRGLMGTQLDAWEHPTPLLEVWEEDGLVPAPTFVGSTDTHDGTFSWPERTVVFAPRLSGPDLAAAVRSGEVLMNSVEGDRLFYGRPELVARIWDALAEGDGLRQAKQQRLRAALRSIDLVSLLEASQPRRVAAGP